MDTLQIEKILKNDSCAKNTFKGVYPKDQLPTVEYPGSYVVNTNPSTALENAGLLCSSTIKDLLRFLIAMAYINCS